MSNVRTLVSENEEITADMLNEISAIYNALDINLSDDTIHTVQHAGIAGQFSSSLKVLVNISKFSGKRIIINEQIRILIE